VGVLVGRDLQADALVQRTAGHPVELGPADLQQRQAPVAGQLHGLGDPLVGAVRAVAGDDVQRGRRDLRAQRLDTGLRPSSSSGASSARWRLRSRSARRRASACACAAPGGPCASRPAGVAPRPASDRRFLPPVPAVAVFLPAPLVRPRR
jgi:hypothetical protein